MVKRTEHFRLKTDGQNWERKKRLVLNYREGEERIR